LRVGGRQSVGVLKSIPVAVIMARKEVARGRWKVPSWRAVGVVAGDNVPGAEARRVPLPPVEGSPQYLWGGFALNLYRDGTESYWYNLVSDNPSLFIVCTQTEDGEMVPAAVTASPDEASSQIEADDQVYSTPIPPEVYLQIEAVVVEHHRPHEKKVRRRKRWTKEPGR
jgi:hypothetical protein